MSPGVALPGMMHVIVRHHGPYALDATLSCGQTFRFRHVGDAFEGVCGDLAMRLEDGKQTLCIDFTAEQGGFEPIIEFLDLAHDSGDPADESEVFLCRRYSQRADLLHSVFLYSRGTHLLR